MAYIGHRCTGCGHRAGEHHDPRTGQPVPCGQTTACDCTTYEPGPPVLVPTYGLRGRTLDTITPPGQKVTNGLHACDCPACHTLHDQLTKETTT